MEIWTADWSGGSRDTRVRTSFSVYQSQSGFGGGLIRFDRQRRKFLQLSASNSTRVSTPITSISGPEIHSISYICARLSIVYVTYTVDECAHMRETERISGLHVDATNVQFLVIY